jgi:hypothetical protein
MKMSRESTATHKAEAFDAIFSSLQENVPAVEVAVVQNVVAFTRLVGSQAFPPNFLDVSEEILKFR